jgi:hypothetical protein
MLEWGRLARAEKMEVGEGKSESTKGTRVHQSFDEPYHPW